METVTLTSEILQKTVDNLAHSVEQLTGLSPKKTPLNTIQDSILKRFDLCYIYFLKHGIAILRSHYQIKLRITTPKKIFNTLYQKQLITPKELNVLLDTVRIKSLSKRSYDSKNADKTMIAIIKTLPAIKQIARKLILEQHASLQNSICTSY